MDFYAMQLTPRKKDDEKEKREEQLKKFREHVITKEELMAELKPNTKVNTESPKTSEQTEEKAVKSISPDFLSPKSFSIFRKENSAKVAGDAEISSAKVEIPLKRPEKKIGSKMPKDIWQIDGANKKVEKPLAKRNDEIRKVTEKEKKPEITSKVGMPSEEEMRKINDFFVESNEKPKKAAPIIHQVEIKNEAKKESEINPFGSDFKKGESLSIVPNKTDLPATPMPKIELPKIQPAAKIKPKEIVETHLTKVEAKPVQVFEAVKIANKTENNPGDLEQKIAKSFMEAVLSDDEKRINASFDELVSYRSGNLERISSEDALNKSLKEKLISAIPALLSYKGGKSALHVFQILDELSIKFTNVDLAKLPDEILKSQELKGVCQKYLLWFAKVYPAYPGQLHDRIYFFNKCGILNLSEIKGFSSLQLAIDTDLVNFIKENVADPRDVERKIYEFALAGLVDEKEFKQEGKVRDVIKKFIANLIVAKKEKPEEAARKIGEYEKIGFIKAGEILEDEKIERVIEKYLLKYRRENHDHPRKVAAMIKDYFNAGLIDKKTRDKLLS